MKARFEADGLLELLAHAFEQPTWHGANLREALSGVTLSQALWRPAPERHNIWELALHCAYWKHVVIRALKGFDNASGFLRQPDNFPALPEARQSAWETDLGLLEETHQTLLECVRSFDVARLDRPTEAGNSRTYAELIFGVANHDLYHAGQIRLLLTLQQGAA
ncbi:MAG: Smu13B [uncultured Truepera sp.]|uniref:Smu13B n=1 Tax=uncultured Truepera sp. TaxID=543023 RepID=A0A6J4VTM9_9DEIN|nr:MAG: Smu13B [uncultured Truepera sp.]